ncbi:hypothetical protein Q7689_05045 [Nocardiopsis tropica]|uniref:hypothetical protein n=1 Tax=Nocardiopsis tropica TaxID=109330 RepID=UPI002E835ED9|nr:hypothetical protein [Nocardiopsis tropica]
MRSRPPELSGPALAALGALLDRSLIQIADAAHDARTFDRETIRVFADVWDNNTFPLFRAATGRTGRERERRARAALEWMASLEPRGRAWLLEQGAAAGHRIDALVQPPPARPDGHWRDYGGTVRPAYSRWTPQTLTELADDYALDAATLRHLRIERDGTRLGGFLTLELARSYAPGDGGARVPTLDVCLHDLAEADVDTGTESGVRLDCDARGASVGLGTRGVLRARSASLRLDDPFWHLSGAGRRADTQVPSRRGGARAGHPPQAGKLSSSVWGAAVFLSTAMVHMRSVHALPGALGVPVKAYCQALRGAGQDILAAGALPRRQREVAFRSLVVRWLHQGGVGLVPWWKRLLQGVPDAAELIREVHRSPLVSGADPAVLDSAREVTGLPDRAELRLVSYTIEHIAWGTRQGTQAVVHLAVPGHEPGALWRLEGLVATDPVRIRMCTEAFGGPLRFRVDGKETESQVLVGGDDVLVLAARAWSREPSSY